MFCIYLVAPLFGGKPSVSALMHYTSWIILALGIRLVSQKGRKGLKIRAHEYSILCLATILNFIIWFRYPINIVLGMLSVVVTVISYRAQNRRMKKDL